MHRQLHGTSEALLILSDQPGTSTSLVGVGPLLTMPYGTECDSNKSETGTGHVRSTIGRPIYQISEEFLDFMISSNFSISRIADFLGVRPSTVKRS